jgi:hypothetical protein
MLKKLDNDHFRRIAEYEAQIAGLYLDAIREASRMSVGVTLGDKPFSFKDYPALRARADRIISKLASDITVSIEGGVNSEWAFANDKNDMLVERFVQNTNLSPGQAVAFMPRNIQALNAFRERAVKGMNLSDRVWRSMRQFRQEIEMTLDVGIREGKSAARISQDLRPAGTGYLNNPDKLFRRVRNQHGQLVLSKNAAAYHPGQGVYRSSFKNALRLARTETNIAYRTADHLRWVQTDFIVGIRVIRSNNPYECSICGSLAGEYPKDFKFTGWHPNCYDEQTEVLTDKGWLFFKDVTTEHKILSLNPETRDLEWVDILLSFGREHDGNMVHFHNKTLDCLVTPEHEMVYLNKTDGRIKRTTASEYTQGKGPIPRGADWQGNHYDSMKMGSLKVDFDLFAEFMGYWLSDGSTIRNSQVVIAQQEGDPNKNNIVRCIRDMGFEPHLSYEKVCFYSRDFCSYLKQFGTSYIKYVPEVIKNASSKQIEVFLNAFISCDGYIRAPKKSFIGDRGKEFTPTSDERMYFTTSHQMAADLGELILKIGKRPSYRLNQAAGKKVKFKNGEYEINHDCYTINECKATTASVFKKDIVAYKGMVYDVTLSKNAIMYIRRNGKCFWGSNCRCRAVPIFSTESEFDDYLDTGNLNSGRTVKDVNPGFKSWVRNNKDNIQKWKNKPYFLQDNKKFAEELL